MSKFFLYARKSTDEPDRQILSIEAQIDELKANSDNSISNQSAGILMSQNPLQMILGLPHLHMVLLLGVHSKGQLKDLKCCKPLK